MLELGLRSAMVAVRASRGSGWGGAWVRLVRRVAGVGGGVGEATESALASARCGQKRQGEAVASRTGKRKGKKQEQGEGARGEQEQGECPWRGLVPLVGLFFMVMLKEASMTRIVHDRDLLTIGTASVAARSWAGRFGSP